MKLLKPKYLILLSNNFRERNGRIVNVFEHLHAALQLSRPEKVSYKIFRTFFFENRRILNTAKWKQLENNVIV